MKKILVVDDDLNILEVVKIILTTYGFEVDTNSTGLNVPESILNSPPNLILLDIRLPGKPGTEICKEIKQNHPEMPVILFSAHVQETSFLTMFGADAFMKKPFDVKDLLSTINLYVN